MNDFDYLAQLPGEEREQDWIRMRLETLSVREGIVLAAALLCDPPKDMVQAINQLQSLDEYTVCLDVSSYEALGRQYLLNETRMPQDALPYIDLDEAGRRYEDKHPGLFIGSCYVRYPETPPKPVYQPGMALPNDNDWSVKAKLASHAVPNGVWLRLPGTDQYGDESSTEEALALRELRVRRWDECILLDTRCVLPEVENLMAQYSGSIGDLIYDGTQLGCILGERGQGEPHWMDKFAAALELEDRRSLRFALDVSQNMGCYHWVSNDGLADYAAEHLRSSGVTEELLQSVSIDLDEYAADLLETSGYMLTSAEDGYIIRNTKEFHYQFSTPAQPQEEPGMEMH